MRFILFPIILAALVGFNLDTIKAQSFRAIVASLPTIHAGKNADLKIETDTIQVYRDNRTGDPFYAFEINGRWIDAQTGEEF
jgi:hypothetical protein